MVLKKELGNDNYSVIPARLNALQRHARPGLVPGIVAGIYIFLAALPTFPPHAGRVGRGQDVDGRDKPRHELWRNGTTWPKTVLARLRSRRAKTSHVCLVPLAVSPPTVSPNRVPESGFAACPRTAGEKT
jgi:hypothetical protein